MPKRIIKIKTGHIKVEYETTSIDTVTYTLDELQEKKKAIVRDRDAQIKKWYEDLLALEELITACR